MEKENTSQYDQLREKQIEGLILAQKCINVYFSHHSESVIANAEAFKFMVEASVISNDLVNSLSVSLRKGQQDS